MDMRRSIPIAIAVLSLRAHAGEPVVLHDLDVAVDRVLVVGAEASLYVGVSGASDLFDSRPAPGAAVVVTLANREVARLATDADGHAVARFRVPGPAGAAELRVSSRSPWGGETVTRPVLLVDRVHVHLRADRPEYRPGETVRWRVTALSDVDAGALAGLPVEIAVADPRGTEIWRGRVTTGAGGMVAGAIPLADDLLLGAYTLRATAAGTTVEETVGIRTIELPPFFVRLERRPGGAEIVARLPYGEPVRGTAQVTIDGAPDPLAGPLDADGRLAVSFAPDGDVHVSATVTDGAGRRVAAQATFDAPGDELELALVPESRRAVAGAAIAVTVVTTDGRGAFVPAQITVKVPGVAGRVAAGSAGAARIPITVPQAARGRLRLEASAVAADGRVARQQADVEIAARALRLVEAVVPAGAPVEVDGRWPEPRGPVIATLLRHGAPLAVAVARVDDGRLRATLAPPPGTFGLATVRVTELAWSRDGRLEPATERAPVYLLPAALDLSIDGALRHRPGATAELAVTVRDGAGRPAAGASLAASVVDERILALGAPRPDLPTALQAVDGRAAGLAFADLLGRGERVALRAIVESLPAAGADADLRLAAAERVAAERARVERLRAAVFTLLVTDPGPIGVRGPDSGWEFAAPLPELLARARVPAADRPTPWRRPTDWAYARRLDERFTFAELAEAIADERLDRLARLRPGERAPAYLRVDPWGRPVRRSARFVASAGPDGLFDTRDDRVRALGHGSGIGTGYGFGSVGYGIGGGGRMGRGAALAIEREPAVRERFDDTVLWVAGIETDAAGRATLAVPLADSVTGWAVAVEAVAGGGAVGAARARLETFLPLHVDVEVPAQLTVGDSYTLPVVVANHTAAARTLAVTLSADGAIAGAARETIAVPAGAVAAVHVPVRAVEAGEGRVLVQLDDGLDAVRRTIRVEPPGAEVRAVHPATMRDGAARLAFEVPATASGRLRLFRGALDQSLDGLEGLLREPHGCFEQTSSTTYPNLLVLTLLGDGHADVRARALDLVGKGYQRLISFEVHGGGFSWFGEAPANQVLSAYGLLELSDMARVYPVDAKLLERTRAWLLGRQRHDGSWAPDASWLHDWSAVQGRVSTTAYVAWALAESGYRGAPLERARAFLRDHRAEVAADPYLLALWAAADPAAAPLVRARLSREAGGVVVRAGGRTLFDATGRAADVQVTALAATVLARSGAGADARAALRWLWSARDPRHGWGSTQGDVLALRAAALATPPPRPGGSVRVRLDDRDLGALDLAADGVPTLDLAVTPGRHVLALAGERDLDAELRLAWRTAGAPPPSAHGLEVALEVPAAPVAVGAAAPMRVTVRNPGRAAIAMPTVVVPVPPGFRADPGSLRALHVARFEDQGSELRLYLTALAPASAVELPFRLEAVAACRVAQRPAQAYAYYDPDVRGASAAAVLAAVSPEPAAAATR
jgi:hypothetical protein